LRVFLPIYSVIDFLPPIALGSPPPWLFPKVNFFQQFFPPLSDGFGKIETGWLSLAGQEGLATKFVPMVMSVLCSGLLRIDAKDLHSSLYQVLHFIGERTGPATCVPPSDFHPSPFFSECTEIYRHRPFSEGLGKLFYSGTQSPDMSRPSLKDSWSS